MCSQPKKSEFSMTDRKTSRPDRVLTSRTYIHSTCGEATEISNPEFQAFANPLAEMEETHCSHCEIADSITQFQWADTGECIADYFARHRKNIPPEALEKTSQQQVIRYAVRGAVIGAIIGIALGTATGMATSLLIGIISGAVLTLIAAPLGAIMNFMKFESRVVQPLLEKHLGVKDVGELR